MATTYLTRTSWGTATNRQKFTQSFWIKRGVIGVQQALLGVESGGNNEARVLFRTDDTLEFYDYQSGYTFRYITNRKFRDCSAWYNIVLRVDTDNGTVANRVRIYINGVQETSFSTETQPSRYLNTFYNSSGNHIVQIGRQSTGNSYFTGSMSHVNFLDGEDRDGSFFGSTDSTIGEWKINPAPSGVNYGTNGYFILKDGNTLTDSSTNSNNFSLGAGAITKTEDCPSNVFATFNPLNSWGDTVLTNGNTTAGNTGTSAGHVSSTIHMNSGKWYMEFNVDTHLTGYSAPMFLLAGTGVFQNLQVGWNASGDGSYGIGSNAKKITDGVVSNASFSDLNAGNKVQIAYDADAGKAWFGINGAYLDSGNPTTAANPYFTTTKLQNNDVSLIILGYNGNAMSANFGNGYFGTTAITTNSGNGYSGAEGSSKFNYTVPTGYSALNTKGLNL